MIVEEESFWKHWAQRLLGPHHHEPPPPPTRQELVDALANCDRQLEILRQGPVRSGDFGPPIAEMEQVRAGLAQALAEFGPDGPAAS